MIPLTNQRGSHLKREVVDLTGGHDTESQREVRSSSLSSWSIASSSGPMKVELGSQIEGEQRIQKDVVRDLPAPPDVLVLYWTLVRDGVLPGRHESQFASLEHAFLKGAKRASMRTAGSDNLTSAVWLHQRSAQNHEKNRDQTDWRSIRSSWQPWIVPQSSVRVGKKSTTTDPTPDVTLKWH